MDWTTTLTHLRRLGDFADREAWERVEGHFRAPIQRFARQLGVPGDDAADVAQETLLALARSIRDGAFDPGRGSLSRWIFGIAYRQSLAALRRRRDLQASSVLMGIADEQSASSSWDVEWERAMLERCEEEARAHFEPATFDAYRLVVHEGCAPSEAAARLGVEIKSVYNAKHRVLARIRELRARMDPG